MNVNSNFNKKGDTNVKQESIVDDAEVKGTAEEDMAWDDFQVMGESEKAERSYVAPPEADKALAELKRAKGMKIGQSILGILNRAA